MKHSSGFAAIAIAIIVGAVLFVGLVLVLKYAPKNFQYQAAILSGHSSKEMIGNSMEPTMPDGSVWQIEGLMGKTIERGDVVMFSSAGLPGEDGANHTFIKRIIGLPGEKIMIQNGAVYINGLKLDESKYLHAGVVTNPASFLAEGQEVLIPANSFAVLGDNRQYSYDSRAYGLVTSDKIEAKLTRCVSGCSSHT